LYTYTPTYDRYAYAIQVKITAMQICCAQQHRRITHPFHGQQRELIDATHEIYTTYQALYELIKDTVVPYMQVRHKEETDAATKKRYLQKITQMKELQHRYMEEYDAYRKQFQERMEYAKTELNNAMEELGKLEINRIESK